LQIRHEEKLLVSILKAGLDQSNPQMKEIAEALVDKIN
jgi:hypothetical protein